MERIAAAAILRARLLLTSRSGAVAAIERERVRILALAGACDPERAARRVLIDRLRGLEDSSRYWSVHMTLDHLRIVNTGVAGTIRGLLAGRAPSGTASTAVVKPSPDAGESAVAGFDESCGDLLSAVSGRGSLATGVRFPHPWFGPLDAFGWTVLAGVHMDLHYRQLERILAAA
jgi:hypothetical protein